MMKIMGWTGATLAALTLASPAQACTLCSCSASTSGISFGGYDPTSSTPKDATGTITLDCTGLLALAGTIEVAISAGGSGNMLARQMSRGSWKLNYNLYTDATHSTVWGNGSAGTSKVSAPLNGLLVFSQSLMVYGRIPKSQWTQAGDYSDSVTVTITY